MAVKNRNSISLATQQLHKPKLALTHTSIASSNAPPIPDIQSRTFALQQMSCDLHIPISTLRQSIRLYRN
ncbi:MAG: hypothetical protein JWO13_2732 [Acidobacteriales bacterium]|nr:hypothetical protein [Terriglobales bacterium]